MLKPENVLEILLGFQCESGKVGIKARKVESLWEIFKWANEQDNSFKHLPWLREVLALLLVHVGMLREAEFLLCKIESQGISLDSHEIFGNLKVGFVVILIIKKEKVNK